MIIRWSCIKMLSLLANWMCEITTIKMFIMTKYLWVFITTFNIVCMSFKSEINSVDEGYWNIWKISLTC